MSEPGPPAQMGGGRSAASPAASAMELEMSETLLGEGRQHVVTLVVEPAPQPIYVEPVTPKYR